MDTDEEIDKYDEATLIASNPPPLAATRDKRAVYNPLNGRNDVLVPLSLGGYVKLGEEPVDRLAEVRKYADELQQMEQPFDMADYEAAGFTQREVEDAGIIPQGQEPSIRTEPLREGEELRMRREGAAMVTPDDPTMREDLTRLTFENTEGDLRQIFEVLGIDRSTARKMAEGLWGNPESTRDLGLGVADFTPAGLFFGAQEGMRTFQRGRNTGDPLTIGMGALEAGLSFLEALPLTAAGAKGLKASIPSIRNALTELGRRMNQPGDMPTTSSFGVGAINDATAAAVPETSTGLPGRISTRLPTAKAATEDPLTGTLVVGLEEMKADPKLYEFNVNITKDYPNMRVAPNATVNETSEQFITHVKDNLLYLHDKVPADTRARSQKWYDGARAVTDRWQAEYDVPDTSIAGALAALSPQKDWYQNVSLAKRTLDVVVNQKDFAFSPEMLTTFENIPALNKPAYQEMRKFLDGKTYAEISHPDPKVENGLKAMFVRLYDQTYNKPDYPIVSPEGDFLDLARTQAGNPKKAAWGSLNEIGKAVAAIEANGDVNIISPLMGERHKVRNFYNNIYDPNSPLGDVTIDTHAVAAGLLRPLSGNALEVDHNFKNMSVKGRGTTKGSAKTGVSGNYGLYAEAYRRAAAERGIQPRQMQSITWEAVRGLFTDTFKSNQKNVAEVDSIWQRYKDGEIELDETRRLVDERAGGINPPTWE
jgi:hypothetical protein